jgi:hypothetical protein
MEKRSGRETDRGFLSMPPDPPVRSSRSAAGAPVAKRAFVSSARLVAQLATGPGRHAGELAAAIAGQPPTLREQMTCQPHPRGFRVNGSRDRGPRAAAHHDGRPEVGSRGRECREPGWRHLDAHRRHAAKVVSAADPTRRPSRRSAEPHRAGPNRRQKVPKTSGRRTRPEARRADPCPKRSTRARPSASGVQPA